MTFQKLSFSLVWGLTHPPTFRIYLKFWKSDNLERPLKVAKGKNEFMDVDEPGFGFIVRGLIDLYNEPIS